MNLHEQNEVLKASFKFWRNATLAVTAVSLACIVSMAGTINGLQVAAESADKQYRERIETETRLRDRAVREMAEMSLQLAEMKREQIMVTAAVATAEAAPEPIPEPGPEYLGEFTLTAYCCERYNHICGNGDGLTATCTYLAPGIVAVDQSVIPLGSKIVIDGQEYRAEDTGGAIKGNKIDIAVTTHEEALSYGVQTADVYIINE